MAASQDAYARSDTRYMPVCHSSLCPQQYQWFGNTAGRKSGFKTIMQLVEDVAPLESGSGGDGPSDQAPPSESASGGSAGSSRGGPQNGGGAER